MNLVSQLLSRLCNALGGVTLVVMTTIVVVDVCLRTLFNQTLGFVEEVTGYLVVVVTFFGVSITFREGAMFRVSFLYEKFPLALQKALGIVYLTITIVFCGTMMWFTSLMVWSSFTRGKIAATELQTPIYIPQILLPVGFLILLLFAVDRLLQGGSMGGSEEHALPVDESAGE